MSHGNRSKNDSTSRINRYGWWTIPQLKSARLFLRNIRQKSKLKKFAAKYGTPRPPSGKIFKKAASPELACVCELQKTGTTLVQKLYFRKIINTNDECLELFYLKAWRPPEINALAEEKNPRQKAIGFFYETFVKNSKINVFCTILCLAMKT